LLGNLIRDDSVVLAFKMAIGALFVLVVTLLAQTKNYYLAGLLIFFPSFSLIGHYLVGSERTTSELRETLVFTGFSILPYLAYLVTLYFLINKFTLVTSLVYSTGAWAVASLVLVWGWNR
jgi:uncharacterized membrane protein (GlpM family)